MVIYVDELFLENFIMNYIILYITAYFSKSSSKWYRLSGAAVIGAIYVIVTYIINISIYSSLFFKIILSVLMIVVGFEFKKITEFIKIIFLFYLVTFSVGGAGLCIGYFSDTVTISEAGVIYVKEISLKIVVVSMAIIFIITKILITLLKNRIDYSEQYYEINIILNEKKIKMNAFLDTGNTVHEPYSNKSVIFVESRELRQYLPEYIYEDVLKNERIETIYEFSWKKRIVLIPISTVNDRGKLKIGIRADKIIINGMIEKDGIVIVPCESISKDGSYSALISKDLLFT